MASCGTTQRSYYAASNWRDVAPLSSDDKIVESLYLVGDAGLLDGTHNYVLDALKQQLSQTGPSTLVYLGDNIYAHGLPPVGSPDRKGAEDIINAQLSLAPYVNGPTAFIPGNHDWNHASAGGLERLRDQEEYIESYYAEESSDHKVKMYPSRGCGDPKVVKINKNLVYVYIDTQWWLQDWSQEPEINHGCDISSRHDFIQRINEIFIDHKNDEIVLMMHHPTQSNGRHGGKFSWRDHFFPLTFFKRWAYIPLPGIGSIYPLYRQVDGTRQEVQNRLYTQLMDELERIANSVSAKVIYASGHEHSLQLFEKGNQIQIISGSGAKESYAQRGSKASYVRSDRGFAKLSFLDDGAVWVNFYTVAGQGQPAILDFRKQLRTPRAGTEELSMSYPSITAAPVTIAADGNKSAGKIKRTLMGAQYRDIWTTPVTIPTIDLTSREGGLRPVKKGGGMSSNSLRLEADDGKQYILRSVNKVFTRALPDEFKNLKLIEVIKDQNSAYHPYGSIVAGHLSQAADVYYTAPEVVYLKRQAALGAFNKHFPEEIYMYEQRPDGDWSDTNLFGGSSAIISYNDLLVRLREKKRHVVDQEWVLKSRMFDLLIHDWDRHDDQWRWASFKQDGKTIYRPIPRDRDLAFYKFVGAIPWFISKAVVTKYKTMEGNVKDVKSLTLNAKTFDRFFLNDLEWSEWIPIIEQLQGDITDNVIDTSVEDLPAEVQSLTADELFDKLKARRGNLLEIGKRFYDLLSTEVEVVGTDNEDLFGITHHSDGTVTVTHSVVSKHGNIERFSRTFYPEETDEVRLYGRRGDDVFKVTGAGSTIKVRVIGGEGADVVNGETSTSNIYVYDTHDGVTLTDKVKDKTSNDLSINNYDRYAFKYDASLVAPQVRINRDGVWLGGKHTKIKNSWRAEPYKSKREIRVITAPAGQDAIRVDYRLHRPNTIGRLDFSPYVNVDFPVNNNFFGFGNETRDTAINRDFNWVRMNQINVLSHFSVEKGPAKFSFGPTFDTYYLYNRDQGIITLEAYEDQNFDKRNYFLGGSVAFDLESVDSDHMTTSGIRLNANAKYSRELAGDRHFFTAGATLGLYVPISRHPQITIANQLGYQWIDQNAFFFQMPFLGNNNGLRGVRGNRYIGQSVFYENVDLRIKILDWNNSILPMDLGLIGGYDIGRVWLDGEASTEWHDSKTIGAYLDVLGLLVVHGFYSFTEDGQQFSLLTRFSF
jgi:hypothetical protein